MGAVNCCAQTAPSADAWKTGAHRRTLTKEELERVDMPMYSFEPSLSLDFEGRGSSVEEVAGDGISDLGNFDMGTPCSQQSSHDFGDTSVVILSPEGYVEFQDEEKVPPPPPSFEDENEPISAALLPAPQSCPRSGMNLRRLSPTFGSGQKHATTPRRAESVHEGIATPEPRLEDYLCSCKYCPRAMSIKRAFQIYGFALDHPESHSLMRVLRACANYDETVLDMDPLILLHAEKMLEELELDEDQTFRLLIASHFKPT